MPRLSVHSHSRATAVAAPNKLQHLHTWNTSTHGLSSGQCHATCAAHLPSHCKGGTRRPQWPVLHPLWTRHSFEWDPSPRPGSWCRPASTAPSHRPASAAHAHISPFCTAGEMQQRRTPEKPGKRQQAVAGGGRRRRRQWCSNAAGRAARFIPYLPRGATLCALHRVFKLAKEAPAMRSCCVVAKCACKCQRNDTETCDLRKQSLHAR